MFKVIDGIITSINLKINKATYIKAKILILSTLIFISCSSNKKETATQQIGTNSGAKTNTPSVLETNNPSFNPKTGEFVVDKYTVGLWHLNEGKEEFAFDSSKYENDGFIPNPKWSDGLFSKCLNINTGNNALEIDDEKGSLSPNNAITIEGWFFMRRNQPSSYPKLIAKHIYSIWAINTQHNWYPKLTIIWGLGEIMGDKPEHVNSNIFWKDLAGNWHYIAGTYNGKFLRVYVDGNLAAQKKVKKGTKIESYSGSLYIGKSGGNFMNGLVDEVRISNVARSAKAIKQYYTQVSKLIKKR